MTRDRVEWLEADLISCNHERIIVNLNQLGLLEHVRLTVSNDLIRYRLLLDAKVILVCRYYLLEGLRRLLGGRVLDIVDSKLVCFTGGTDFDKFDCDDLA